MPFQDSIAHDIKFLCNSGVFWDEYKSIKQPADGHSLMHSIVACIQHKPNHSMFNINDLIPILVNECHSNIKTYLPYFDGDITLFQHQICLYVSWKKYGTSFGDIVPLMLSNALNEIIVVIENSASGYHTAVISPKVENNLSISYFSDQHLFLYKEGDHFDACVCSHPDRLAVAHIPCKSETHVKRIFDNSTTGSDHLLVSESVNSCNAGEPCHVCLMQECVCCMYSTRSNKANEGLSDVSAVDATTNEDSIEMFSNLTYHDINDCSYNPKIKIMPPASLDEKVLSDSSHDCNGMYTISTLTTILNSGLFCKHFRYIKSHPDGHCIVHSVASCLHNYNASIDKHDLYSSLLNSLRTECKDNHYRYLPMFESYAVFFDEMERYITGKQFDLSFVDLVPQMFANILNCLIIVIDMQTDLAFNIYEFSSSNNVTVSNLISE